MKLKTYPSYKNSGVDWLGSVPQEWDVKPLKYITSVNDDVLSELTDSEQEIEYVDIGSVSVENGIEATEVMKFSEAPSRARRKVRDGDVIVSTVRTYLKSIAPINSPPSNLVCSTGFAVIRPGVKLNPVYAKYSMQTGYFIDEVIAKSVGVSYPAINSSDMMCIRITAPPIHEQLIIAAFLDRETDKLNTLISKQERLIELINERIISMVLGAIESSETKFIRLTHVCEVINRPVDQSSNNAFSRLGVLNRGRGLFIREETDSEDMGDSDFFWVKSGDLILSGQFAWEGSVAMADDSHEGCVVSHRFPTIRGKNKIVLTEYLLALLKTSYGDFILNENSRGSAGRNRPLNMSLLLKEKIPIIPMAIQNEVAKLIGLQKKLKYKTQIQIDLLKEHRTALISAAVTGKIDVREAG